MSAPSRASVEGDEQLRLFCALRLPGEVVEALVRWQREQLSGGRIVARENLHVTLAFLGSRPASDVPVVVETLRELASAVEPFRYAVRDYRETPHVGMLRLDELDGGRQTGSWLASALQGRLEELGVYRRERRAWAPHVTVVRFRARPRLAPPLPPLQPFAPSDAAAYLSRLRPDGAQYEVLETVALGG